MQGGGAVARGGEFGQGSGEGKTLGVAAVHHVTIHDRRHDQVVEVDIPEDRCAPVATAGSMQFGERGTREYVRWLTFRHAGLCCTAHAHVSYSQWMFLFVLAPRRVSRPQAALPGQG